MRYLTAQSKHGKLNSYLHERKNMEHMAKVLFEHWKSSDRELQMVWEDLPEGSQVREVFLKQGRALEAAGFGLTPSAS